MLSPRNVWVVARWEFMRPFKSKTTSLSIATLVVSLVLFRFAFPAASIPTDISNSVGSQGLYAVGVVNEPALAELIRASPKFRVVDAPTGQDAPASADFTLVSRAGLLSVEGPVSEKAAMGLDELMAVLRDGNMIRRERLTLTDRNMTFVVYPLWVRFRNISPGDARADYEERRASSPDGISSQNVSDTVSGTQEFDPSNPPEGYTRPGIIELPLPIMPLTRYLIAFIPIVFFSLYSASSILREKVSRQGTYLLSSPLRPLEIVLGKMLPYAAATTLAVSVGGAAQGIPVAPLLLAFLPVAFLCLGVAYAVAVLSDTPHDLNVTLTFLFMLVFAYVFYPAMFKGLSNVSLVSPLGALMEYVDGGIGVRGLLLLLTPVALSAIVVWAAGLALFQDEVLFSHEPTAYKTFRAFDIFLRPSFGRYGVWVGVMAGGIALIPLVYLAELYILFLLLPFGGLLIYLLVPFAAAVEEFAKVFGVAAYVKSRRIRGGPLHGAVAGFAFYAGERIILAASLAQLLESPGRHNLAVAGIIAPLLVHVACSALAGEGLRRSGGRLDWRFFAFLAMSSAIHAAYNLRVMGALHV
jgi:ABC-type Na+ efflux pump permease subunit